MLKRWLALAVTSVAAAILALAPTALASSAEVGPLVPVTDTDPLPVGCIGPNRDAEVEPTLAVDPRDSDNQVLAWMQSPGHLALSNVTANSSDGGRSWSQVLVPGISQCTGGQFKLIADAWLSYGPKGKVYLSSLPIPDSADPDLGMVVNRSTDNGASWSDAVYVDPEPAFNDKEAITADPVRAGTAYMVWRNGQNLACIPCDIVFSRTGDGARSWSEPIPLYDAGPLEFGQVSEVIATGPGKLVAVFTVTRVAAGLPTKVLSRRSKDGGRSWSAPSEIAEVPLIQPRDPETDAPIRYGSHFFTAGGVPGHGVFVAYQDPQSSTESKIMVSSSRNGRQWSKPRLASEGAVNPFATDLAVARNGTVALRFYDFRNDVLGDGPLTTDSWFRHSHDGGRSWKEEKLGAGFDLRTAPVAASSGLPGYQLGEYQGLAPIHNGFATAFARAKPAAKEGATDIFYTSIKVKPGRACKKAKKQVKRAKTKLKKAKKSGNKTKIKKAKKKLKKAKKQKRKKC